MTFNCTYPLDKNLDKDGWPFLVPLSFCKHLHSGKQLPQSVPGFYIYTLIALNYLCSYAHKISVIDLKTIFYNRPWNINNNKHFFICVNGILSTFQTLITIGVTFLPSLDLTCSVIQIIVITRKKKCMWCTRVVLFFLKGYLKRKW